MIEIVVRIRCDKCGIALEQLRIPRGAPLPMQIPLAVPSMPKGWTRDGDACFCPEHPPSRIQVAPVVPNIRIVR